MRLLLPQHPVTLLEHRVLFSALVLRLGDFILGEGYAFDFGETLRGPAQVAADVAAGRGVSNSLHPLGLADDLNIFLPSSRTDAGVPLAPWQLLKTGSDYALFGDYWKSLHELCCWGGDFSRRVDADHFSVTFGGAK